MTNLDWLLDPAVQTASLGACALGLLGLTISAHVSARSARKALREYQAVTDASLRDLGVAIDHLKSEKLKPAPQPEPAASFADSFYASYQPAPANTSVVQGLNLTTRARALQMHHRGESASSIAATLGARQEEVDLLLKLDQMLDPPVVRASYAG